MNQLWQQARIQRLDEMVGNAAALASLRAIDSGFVLIEGPIGCGKTSTALAWVNERFGTKLEEQQAIWQMGRYCLEHVHANDFELEDATKQKMFFYTATPTVIIVDEAQDLQLKRQQSKLKTIPTRANFTLVLVTSQPEEIEASIRDRCCRIRLGPLPAKEMKPMVERACTLRGIPFDVSLLQALNRAQVFRPRAILNVVDSVARGVPVEMAVVGQ
ncbi:MAG: AAA family ATPase [Candidatus Sulfotelmatobacter sp.]